MKSFLKSLFVLLLVISMLSISAKQAHSQSIPIDFTFSGTCLGSPTYFYPDTIVMAVYGVQSVYWTFGDGDSSSLVNPEHTYAYYGTYAVTLTVYADSGYTGTVTHYVTIHPNPVAFFSYNSPNCSGSSVQFTDLSTGNGYINTWIWNFGDGSPTVTVNFPNSPNVSHIYYSSGVFSVSLTVITNYGCSDTLVKQVVINALPSVDFSYTPAQPCVFDPVFFTPIANTASIANYFWQFGDGGTAVMQSPAHTYSVPGTFNVSLTITDTSGCVSSVTKPVTVHANPIANFSFPSVACTGAPVQFTDLTQTNGGGAIIQWYWDFGDPASGASNSSNIQNPQHTYATSGAYIVSLVVTNNNGCIDSLSSIITVNQSPAPSSAITGNTAPCQGSGQTYSVTNVSGNTYTWALPTSWAINTGQGTSSITVTTGTQSGNIAVTPSNSCGSGTPATLAVSPGLLPAQTSAITGNAAPCQASIQTYSVTNVTGTTYIWSVPAGWSITSGQGTSSITLTTGTQNGNISVTPSNSCGNGATTTMAVSASFVTAYAGVDIAIPYGSFTNLYGDASNGSGNYSWSWQPANLLVNPSIQYPVTVNLTATTIFTLTVTDNMTGCTDYDQVTVVVTGGALTVSAFASPDTIYLGDSSQLTAPTGGGTGNYTWSWSSDPAGFTSDMQNPVVSPEETTTYTVTVNDGITTATASVLVTINYLPAPPPLPTGPDYVDLAYSLQTTYSIPAVAGAVSYEWEVYPENAGIFAKSDIEATITWSPSFLGYAIVKVRAYNTYGYSEWSEEKITFVDNTTGTPLHETKKMILYPNPVEERLHIVIPGKISGASELIVVFDSKGRRLSEFPVTTHEMIVDVSAFNPGVYFVRFSDEKAVELKKFIKE